MTAMTQDEALDLDAMVRRALGPSRGYVMIIVEVDVNQTEMFMMSSLSNHGQVKEVLDFAADGVKDEEPTLFKTGGRA